MGKHLFYNICLSCNFFAFKWPNIWAFKKYIVFSTYIKVLYMSNNFRLSAAFLSKYCQFLRTSCLISMKPLGLDAIHFRILTIVRLCFSNIFGRFFRLKIVSLLSLWRENQSGQLRFRAGRMQKTGPLWKVPQPINCFIFTDKK